MRLVVNRENWKDWALIAVVSGFIMIGFWYGIMYNRGENVDNMIGKNAGEKQGAIISGLIDGKDYGTDYVENEQTLFEALVVLRDQQYDSPEEDQRSALKRGDVLAVRKAPHVWSDTERASYLIVKIEMTGKEANVLIAPKTAGDTVVLARARRIDLDRVGFTGTQIAGDQPFAGKVFDTDIIQVK